MKIVKFETIGRREQYTLRWRGKKVILRRKRTPQGSFLEGRLEIVSAPPEFEEHFQQLQRSAR